MNDDSVKVLAECPQRGPWIRNSLKHEKSEMLFNARTARKAFRPKHMALAAEYLAEVYDKAAKVFDDALKEMKHE